MKTFLAVFAAILASSTVMSGYLHVTHEYRHWRHDYLEAKGKYERTSQMVAEEHAKPGTWTIGGDDDSLDFQMYETENELLFQLNMKPYLPLTPEQGQRREKMRKAVDAYTAAHPAAKDTAQGDKTS